MSNKKIIIFSTKCCNIEHLRELKIKNVEILLYGSLPNMPSFCYGILKVPNTQDNKNGQTFLSNGNALQYLSNSFINLSQYDKLMNEFAEQCELENSISVDIDIYPNPTNKNKPMSSFMLFFDKTYQEMLENDEENLISPSVPSKGEIYRIL